MITKVYIDNFRCFTNFELELGSFHLLLGENGSGKSTFFDVLSRIQGLLSGGSVGECFPLGDRTVWDNRTVQDFSMEISVGEERFRYELRVEHNLPERKQRIARERLLWNSHVFYRFEDGDAHLYRIAGSRVVEGSSFAFDWTLSFIPLLQERSDNQPVFGFRKAVHDWATVRLVPPRMQSASDEESATLGPEGRNFSSWYRYLTQAHPEVTSAALQALRDVIPGFQHLRFETMGEGKRLEVCFDNMDRAFPFSQLSDGQRALIALYTLLHSVAPLGYSLHIDEPDNYVCLREIQPWLTQLEDLCAQEGRQAILISHHPELINRLAKDYGIWFSRPDNGPVRARKEYPVVDGLTAAETMARGWDDE